MGQKYDLILSGGLVVFDDEVKPADIAVLNGKIAAVVLPGSKMDAVEIKDMSGFVIFPGLIDTHAHYWEPGPQNYREDFYHATRCCAKGGVTTTLEMPLSIPPVVDQPSFQLKYDVAKKDSVVDFGLYGGCIPSSIDHLKELDDLGCCAFKVFISYANPDYPHMPDHELCKAMEEISKFKGLVAVHAENADIVSNFCEWKKAEGVRQPSRYHEGRPPFAEVEAIQRAVLFSKIYNVDLLICHMSAAEGVDAVLNARRQGQKVFTETCPHYLAYDNTRMDECGAFAKCNPPLRPRENLERLWEHIAKGNIDVIGTDHGPYSYEEKNSAENIWDALPGFGGVELMLHIMLTEGYAKRGIDLPTIAKLTSTNAAKIFGLKQKGSIQIGKDADFAIVDLQRHWKYRGMETFSKTKLDCGIFEGYESIGLVCETIVRGKTVYKDGVITVDSGWGEYIPRQI